MPQATPAGTTNLKEAEPVTLEEFGRMVKAKNPTAKDYQSHTDREVADAYLDRYPQFRSIIKAVPKTRLDSFLDRARGAYHRGTTPGALIGGGLGGVTGSFLGGPVGAIEGASLGAAGGKAIESRIRSGGQRVPALEAAKDLGSAALVGGTGEALTAGGSALLGGAGRVSRAAMKRAAGLLGKEGEWRTAYPGAVDTMIERGIGLSGRGVRKAQMLGKAWSARVDRIIEAGDRAGVRIPVTFSADTVDLLEDMLVENAAKIPKPAGVGAAHATVFSDLPLAEQQLIVNARQAARARRPIDLDPSTANMVKRQLQAFARRNMNQEAGRTLHSGRTLTPTTITGAKAFQRDLNTDIDHYLTQAGVEGYKAATRQVQNYMGAAEAATEATGTKPFKWPKGAAVATTAGAILGKEVMEEPYWGGGAGLSMGLAAAILNSPKAMNWIAMMLGNPQVRAQVLSQIGRGAIGLYGAATAGRTPAPAPQGQ